MQVVGQFSDCTGAVRDGILLLGGHLGEGAVVAVGDEERVVAESLAPLLAVDDAPFDDSLEEVLLAAQQQRDDRADRKSVV